MQDSTGSEKRERLEAEKVTAIVAWISSGLSHLTLSKTMTADEEGKEEGPEKYPSRSH